MICNWRDRDFKSPIRANKTSNVSEGPTDKAEYVCPKCNSPVERKFDPCSNRDCGWLGPHVPVRFNRMVGKTPQVFKRDHGSTSQAPQHYPAPGEPQQISHAEPSSQLKESASKDWLRSTQYEKSSKAKNAVIAGVVAIFIIGVGVFYWGINYNVPQTTSPNVTQPQPTPQTPPPVAAAPLTISDISVSGVTESSVVITWTTNEPSTTQLDYGITNSYGKTSDLSGTLVTSHKVQLSSLNPSTTYHYKVLSKNAGGKIAISPSDSTFITAAPPDITAPVIAAITVPDVSDTTVTIAWTTNEKATTQVEYGTSASYGSTTPMEELLVTSHSITINGLEAEKTYYFRVKSKDATKNETVSDTNQTFKTLAPVPTGLEVGKRAPDFTIYTLDGDPVTLSKLRGKIVMINFWAIGCSACVAEMPDIEAVYKTWSGPKELKLLAINAGDHPIYIEKFKKEENLTMPIYIDSDKTAITGYQISRIPRTFFIDSTGMIRKIELGRFDNQSQLINALNSLQ